MGETRSTFEEDGVLDHDALVSELVMFADRVRWTQAAFDAELESRLPVWGAAPVYALSTAFADAAGTWVTPDASPYEPRLLLNVLNGSLHAYTNPVRSNVHEFLLVPPDGTSIVDQIDAAREILAATRSALRKLDITHVNGNRVHVPVGELDHGAVELAAALIESTDAAASYELMIDAAAGTWVTPSGYRAPVSGDDLSATDLIDLWTLAADKWNLRYIEDPLAETALDAWRALHGALSGTCRLVGDDLISGSTERLRRAGDAIDAVMVKPDQCGTVTNVVRVVDLARDLGLEVMLSHRSIETDSLALMRLAAMVRAEYIKIGPLSGFEAVGKVNAIMRALDRSRP